MTQEQAINVIKQACAAYKGTLQEHQLIQEAIKVVETTEEIKVIETPEEQKKD